MSEITWARSMVTAEHGDLYPLLRSMNCFHWSRQFEYPWVILKGDFAPKQWVLDAAGGDAPLQSIIARSGAQVVNVDNNPALVPTDASHIMRVTGDINKLEMVDGIFDRVLCVSVMEHMADWRPVVSELKRVLKPGGKLLMTMDVASYARWNHTVDRAIAGQIAESFGLSLPAEPFDILKMDFPEFEKKPGDPETVSLRVLCICWEK